MSNPQNNPSPEKGSRVADYDFDLPEDQIAQQPPAERGTSRMLVLDRASGAHTDSSFATLPSLLQPGDVLVLNDSRVIPARLYAQRATSRGKQQPTGQIEVLLTSPDAAGNWNTLVRPGRKVRVGDQLEFSSAKGEVVLRAEVLHRDEFGERLLRFEPVQDFFAAIDEIGHMPLPPYIHRDDANADRERYQTVFAAERGSVAAPTAGLHFTPTVLQSLESKGVEIAKVTLHVGLGTFAPLRVENLDEIHLHRERYTLSTNAADALNRAHQEGRRIVAVGTTAVRTLEHCAEAANGAPLVAHTGETAIFISPGFQFRLVGGLLTNFHLPQSSLLMLVSAFAGREKVLAAYRHAVAERYRFFSYGDCMFIA
ncbi:tRNA preQ1(34) S-adenosylmethionine ribosyltransferase-isomerase QueA [Acidicapsa ligni]|uniref:tRNA preQ1(34) S-adenosylmethionine ribosyltransferase-isomerase QueA n=1 Tax=Acidicapsa ligni TaxID=542300 RepID=UPI0021DF6BF3|nr:tRNA preQ1(34) S-adenosylmethionine ribosyltransferase-isomerase QueA [Acidicapsa ligni]